MLNQDDEFMAEAIAEAKLALSHDDVPVGAVVVKDGKIIGRGHNRREEALSPTAHAEIMAIESAARSHGHWNLTGAKLYVTLEPCPMCAGALVMARIEEVIYAAQDPKGGAESLQIPILQNPKLNHRLKVRQGPAQEESAQLLKEFFRNKRKSPQST